MDQRKKGEASWSRRASSSPRSSSLLVGVLSLGASFLLVRDEDASKLLADRRLTRPFIKQFNASPLPASDFASLSPVLFLGADSLRRKLDSYFPTKVKKKKISQLERHPLYSITPANQEGLWAVENLSRARFEWNRLLYLMRTEQLDLRKFCLPQSSPALSANIFTLAANEVVFDPLNRFLLDVAWLPVETDDSSFQSLPVHHFKISGRDLFKHPDGPVEALQCEGQTMELQQEEVSLRLIERLLHSSQSPAIILCWGYDVWDKFERNFAADLSKSSTSVRLDELLGFDTGMSSAGKRRAYYTGARSRSRSSSPRRETALNGSTESNAYRVQSRTIKSNDQHHISSTIRAGNNRDPDPEFGGHRPSSFIPAHASRRKDLASFYVVDVKELFETVVGHISSWSNPIAPAKLLGLNYNFDSCRCAGNECKVVFDLWLAMASGPSVNDCFLTEAYSPKSTIKLEKIKSEDSDQLNPSQLTLAGVKEYARKHESSSTEVPPDLNSRQNAFRNPYEYDSDE